MKKLLIVGFCILTGALLVKTFWVKREKREVSDTSQISSSKKSVDEIELYNGISYIPIDPSKFDVTLLSDQLFSPTRIRITPDRRYLLITQLTGEVMAINLLNIGKGVPPHIVTRVDTKFPGFPPDEAGLTGIVLSHHFKENGKAYLLYTFKDEDGKTQNRISTTIIKEKDDVLVGSPPEQIWQANTPGTGSHQITDGIEIDVQEEPHLLFVLGEGFEGERAQDSSLEAGKVLLIQEDGADPMGERPYPENPKVQALGIRNAFVMAQNTFDPLQRMIIADTGPDHFDRLLYTQLFDDSGNTTKPINFGWDGTEESLQTPLPDPRYPQVSDMAILRLPDTRTFTGLIVHPGGKGVFQQSDEKAQTVLATLFGRTGFKDNKPGKEIWMGRLTNLLGQPMIAFEPIIERNPNADGKLGNPIGLEVDPETGDFFFADVIEGRLYKVRIKTDG